MRYGQREARGGIGTDAKAIAAAVGEVERALGDLDRSISVRELLGSLALEPGAAEAILARAEISSASSADEIPATDLAGVAHIGDEPSPGVTGGNQGLALGLAAELGDAVRLDEPASLIEWGADGVRVSTSAGGAYDADGCVIAVPATLLTPEARVRRPTDGERDTRPAIRFEPALPAPKREALAGVRYGHAAKLFVPLAEAAGPSAVMNVPERWWCWTQTGEGGAPVPVVSCFAGSPAALERLEVAAGPGRWLESLAALRPELALEPAGAVLCNWDEDPWVGAAYSIFPPAELTAALAEPVGPLAFAGEHIGGPFNGLMEGAIRSGRRAAASLARP